MSTEEDTELRDLISQTLEVNGCFAKIRAQLRASIYLALEEDEMFQKNNFLANRKVQSSLDIDEGMLMFSVVREFLEYFDLEFTISVFEPESYMGSKYTYKGRDKLIEDLNIPGLKQESPDPVLLQLIHICKLSNKLSDIHTTDDSVSSLNYKNDLISHSSVDENKSSFISVKDNTLNRTYNNVQTTGTLDLTFNVSVDSPDQLKSELYIGSKIEEDISNPKVESDMLKEKLLIDFDKSINQDNEIDFEESKFQIEQSLVDADFSSRSVKDAKHSKFDSSFDKTKLSSPKGEKIKIKNNLSPLSDLPPLQMSKSRANDMLLPSLYMKEFKDKNNHRDIDRLFDLEPMDNYEEDFISESEIDVTLSKQESSKINLLEEFKQQESFACENITRKGITLLNETELCANKVSPDSNSTASTVTSEDFEINSNVDDILSSC